MTREEVEIVTRAYRMLRWHTDPAIHPMIDALERLHEVDRLSLAARRVYLDALAVDVLGDNTQFSRKAGLRAVKP